MWQKKIRGKLFYFGHWARRVDGNLVRVENDGWKEALHAYLEVRDDLHAGRTPRVKSDGLTVANLCNAFLTAKLRKVESGELTSRSFMEYRQTTDLIVSAFGKNRLVEDLAAGDFEKLRAEMAAKWGPVRLGNAVIRVKSVFKYGTDNGLIEKAVRFGGEFTKPEKAVLRKHKATGGQKMLEADQVRKLLDSSDGQLRAMILLAVNAGFGNGDCATLPLSALNLKPGWVDFPRPKTGISRRCPLWPETVEALREVIANRPAPKDDTVAKLVFVNTRGSAWIHFTPTGGRIDNVTIAFTNLLKELDLHRPGVGFYTLRHVHRTIADGARDTVAADLIMGHADPSMGAHYRERVEDGRLRGVADHVRRWLFGQTPDRAPSEPEKTTTDTRDPSAAEEDEGGDQGPHGPRCGAPSPPPARRPTLRLYVG
jgi:integrase